ncbi:MAG: hypothetical protein J6Q82_01740 [Clostridia bacterium]|nr:hypothetical protein [Clostridia bacterium]
MAVFAMLGAIMFVSKLVMEFLPNVHLIGALTMIYTIVYRSKALIPLYIFVFLSGLYGGFSLWWMPYLYVWTVLWAVTMLLPKKMPTRIAIPVYMVVCALHGLLFGVLYAPAQALLFGLNFKQTVAWVAAGFPFDVIHTIGNFVAATLVLPLSRTLLKLEGKFHQNN